MWHFAVSETLDTHCISLQPLIKKHFYLKLLCMIVFTCRFCSITNLFCLMSAIDEQEEENSKKCEMRQNSDSHRQLNFQKINLACRAVFLLLDSNT